MNNVAFINAVNSLVEEKGISKEEVFEAMELALTSAYKKHFNGETNVRVDINQKTGDIRILSVKTVVKSLDDIVLEETEEIEEETKKQTEHIVPILLKDAKKIVPNIKVGETIEEEVTPKDFGRVATSTAKQVVIQKIKEAERVSIINEYEDSKDELVVGILSMEDEKNYYVDLGRARAILPKSEIIPGENLIMGSSIKVYITKIEATTKGPFILVSRCHYGFIKRLFEHEIPELVDGTITLYSVARDPGVRSKVALYSDNIKIDPIGSCIGEKGSRINNILKELNGERVDLIKYDKDPVTFITNALAPAKNLIVMITDPKNKQALAIPNNENLSLAIGKKGSNVRLATILTQYKITIKTKEQLKEEGIDLK